MSTPETLTLQTIKGFHLDLLADPEEGFRIDIDPTTEKKTKDIDELRDTIADEVDRLREKIATLTLPPEMQRHPFYPAFIQRRFEDVEEETIDLESPLISLRNILALVPRHPDIDAVEKRLKETADFLMGQMTSEEEDPLTEEESSKVKRMIRNALFRIIQDNLLAMDKQPVIRRPNFDDEEEPDEPDDHPTGQTDRFSMKALWRTSDEVAVQSPTTLEGISMYEVRKIVGRLKDTRDAKVETARSAKKKSAAKKEAEVQKINKDTCYELMVELGFIPKTMRFEDKKHFLEVEMPTCLSKAIKRYESVGETLQEAQQRFKIGGKQIGIDLAEAIKYKNIFELLEFVVTHHRKRNDYQPGELPELNAANTVVKYFFDFFYIRSDARYLAARSGETDFRRQFAEAMFKQEKPDEEVEVWIDEKNDIVPKDDSRAFGYREVGLRHIQVEKAPDGMQTVRVYYQARRKDSTALMTKMNNNPDYSLDRDIFDFWGGRVFLWDITLEDYLSQERGPAIQETINELARKMGRSMGLRESYVKDRKELSKGEFMIESKIARNTKNGKSRNYPAMKIYGILDNGTRKGLPIEFQIVLKEGYITTESNSSPNNQKNYDLLKACDLADKGLTASVNPGVAEITQTIRERLEAQRDEWFSENPDDQTGLASYPSS